MSNAAPPLEATADATSRPEQHARCELQAGTLTVRWRYEHPDTGDDPAPPFGFAERNNPRRAFLFVSTVLGRHVPVAPARVRAAFTTLADGIDAELPGPILMTGMAETAVGLGAGVHDAYVERTGRSDVLYLSSTRAQLDGTLLATFDETHSHASAHQLYRPHHTTDARLLDTARSLVMVDDEASSGATFAHLAQALVEKGVDRFTHVHTAVLTDWSGPLRLPAMPSGDEVTVSRSALLSGRYDWTAAENAPVRTLPDADEPREARVSPLQRVDDARLGRAHRSARELPPALLARVRTDPGPILILGTGEHVWEPFLIAEALETHGHDVRFSATTRSPILPGHAVRRGFAFTDHEGLGITNYLYNVAPDDYAHIILCVDTALDAIDPALIATLGAHVLVGTRFHPHASLDALCRSSALIRTFIADDDPSA